MKVMVQKLEGEASGDIELKDEVFGVEPRADILHRVVTWQLENRRATGVRHRQGGVRHQVVRQLGVWLRSVSFGA